MLLCGVRENPEGTEVVDDEHCRDVPCNGCQH